MPRRRVRPLAACTIAAAAVIGTAAMPGVAGADDGVVDPLASVTAAAAQPPQALVEDALAGAAEDALPGAAENAATEPLDSLDASTEAVESAQAPEPLPDVIVSEAPVSDPVVGAATEPDTTEHEAIDRDTTPVEDDIAVDTLPVPASVDPLETPATPGHETPPAARPPTASEPPAPSQTTANVNVSVRIGSPGDNGSVMQVNVVSAPSPATQSVATTPQPPAPEEMEWETTTTETTDTWYWRWDCLGIGPLGAISPFGSTNGSIPASWTWIWNCGDKLSQYQDESMSGYRQINTNVSIRIASPGNDGSVTQVNLAAGARFSSPVLVLPSLPAAPRQSAPATPPALPLELGVSLDLPMTLPPPVFVGGIALPEPVSAPDATVPTETVAAVPPVPEPSSFEQRGTVARLPFGDVRAWSPTAPAADHAAVGQSRVAVEPKLPAAGATRPFVGGSSGAVSRPKPVPVPKKRTAPHWRPSPPQRSAPAPVSTASAAAAGVGGSSGSGLPFLLALPFVAALLDLARRVALERATWPSGHRRRAPDRPG